ncbi:hypothetical protein CcrC1_gp493 [Caulobacter phage C1]|nr:hypothetical protein CcrC1_gp001 [Caulobacter phage C1]UTU08229.1 hypothetical protein CcrC2_gp001 [Caulobacter phage C2]UTU08752.1 hypothetical protein CcrJ4_gp001 [Caulobacter phage J4]WGN96888.1 hypothetical protein [Bertelyvirus sp.]UTU08181.1 hypothetical protein CcrC1_gp493 [Caulobacter phage C1]
MSTLAYKDGVLAADTRVTDGGVIVGSVSKIRRVGPVLIAGCGDLLDLERFHVWVKAGLEDGFAVEDSECWLIAPGHPFLVFEATGFLSLEAPFHAAGSGGKFARGALSMGADAVEAIRCAQQHDTLSGGPIDVLYLDGRPSQRLAS